MGGVITNDGKKIFLDRAYNSSPTRSIVSQFKVGVGTTEASASQTDLIIAIPISGTEAIDSCDSTTGWSTSAGLQLSENTTTFKEGTGCLNYVKTTGASTAVSCSKSTTSRDGTNKEVSVWVYIIDNTMLDKLSSTECLILRLGSDVSNYFEWKKDKADLSGGQWNLVQNLEVSSPDLVNGSPVTASLDYTYVGVSASDLSQTWSAGDLLIDDIKLVSSGNYLGTFESGWPVIDFNLLQASIRCRLSTVQANGYLISEAGVFNSDGTPLMESRDNFTGISKTSNDEIIFIFKNLVN